MMRLRPRRRHVGRTLKGTDRYHIYEELFLKTFSFRAECTISLKNFHLHEGWRHLSIWAEGSLQFASDDIIGRIFA